MTAGEKLSVASALKRHEIGTMPWQEAVAALWIHFCYVHKVTPSEASSTASQAYRKVLKDWAPVVARYTPRTCQLACERNWAPGVGIFAVRLHEAALSARSRAVAGESIPLPLPLVG